MCRFRELRKKTLTISRGAVTLNIAQLGLRERVSLYVCTMYMYMRYIERPVSCVDPRLGTNSPAGRLKGCTT